jgi:hypothetical protein
MRQWYVVVQLMLGVRFGLFAGLVASLLAEHARAEDHYNFQAPVPCCRCVEQGQQPGQVQPLQSFMVAPLPEGGLQCQNYGQVHSLSCDVQTVVRAQCY